jgi:hypothetical protein
MRVVLVYLIYRPGRWRSGGSRRIIRRFNISLLAMGLWQMGVMGDITSDNFIGFDDLVELSYFWLDE